MTYLYLVRHGETVDNVNQILQGQTDGQLTPNGILQAEKVRDNLKKSHFDAIVSSDLQRSVDTALIIAQPHGLEVEKIQLLRERDWGGFTGEFIPDLKDKVWPDDIETLEHMMARAHNFITYIKASYKDKHVLAVGHGIINKAIQAVYYNKTMSEISKMANGEVRILIL
ncbi:MAG: histidine phosphatase family protein [Prevotella sp.]|nr:histidine phosphatase family protein [Prevotella sp.]